MCSTLNLGTIALLSNKEIIHIQGSIKALNIYPCVCIIQRQRLTFSYSNDYTHQIHLTPLDTCAIYLKLRWINGNNNNYTGVECYEN